MSPLETTPGTAGSDPVARLRGGRLVWHAIAWLLAAAVLWLVFASYRQPDLMLDLAGMRLCGSAPFASAG